MIPKAPHPATSTPPPFFFCLVSDVLPSYQNFLPRAQNSSAPGVFCLITSASLIFQKNSIASLRNITNGFKSRQVSTSRDPVFLSEKTKRDLKNILPYFYQSHVDISVLFKHVSEQPNPTCLMHVQFINHFERRSNFMHYLVEHLEILIMPTECIYAFCADLRTKNNYSYLQQ